MKVPSYITDPWGYRLSTRVVEEVLADDEIAKIIKNIKCSCTEVRCPKCNRTSFSGWGLIGMGYPSNMAMAHFDDSVISEVLHVMDIMGNCMRDHMDQVEQLCSISMQPYDGGTWGQIACHRTYRCKKCSFQAHTRNTRARKCHKCGFEFRQSLPRLNVTNWPKDFKLKCLSKLEPKEIKLLTKRFREEYWEPTTVTTATGSSGNWYMSSDSSTTQDYSAWTMGTRI
jgi:hypothetical protein